MQNNILLTTDNRQYTDENYAPENIYNNNMFSSMSKFNRKNKEKARSSNRIDSRDSSFERFVEKNNESQERVSQRLNDRLKRAENRF